MTETKTIRMIKRLCAALILFASASINMASAKDLPGSSETSWGVSPSGAFNFQMPVMTPAGRNGLKPSLSITYSSSQGNGSLGVGWNVSDLSAITRCGQTQATNGKTTGVIHGASDRFCMGGQQLRMVEGSAYGEGGSEYRTEVEQFAKVVAVGSGSKNLADTGTAPTSWKVWAKDGRIYTYGATADSRLDIPSRSNKSTHRWSLNKVEDRSGNYYTAAYRESDGLPLRIDYTFNSGLSANQSIDYIYESRPDQRSNYLFGRAIQQNVRLNKITVKNNSAVYREYKFDYEIRNTEDLRPSRLASIEECGQNDSCLPKIPVAWQSETDGFSDTASTDESDKLPTYLTKYAELNGVDTELSYGTLADINADGLIDVVVAVIEPNGTFKAETHLKTPNGWQLSNEWTLPHALRSYDEDLIGIAQFTQSQLNQGRLVDVNGDGLVDLVVSYEHFTDATQAHTRKSVSEVYLNSETGFETTPSTTYVPPTIGSTGQKQVLVDYTTNGNAYSVMQTERARLIDLNGDGLVDWVMAYFDYVGNNSGVPHTATYLNTGSGWSSTASTDYEMPDYFVEYIGINPPLPHGDFVDINSDGLVDWVQSYQYLGRDAAPVKSTWLNTGSGWQRRQGNDPYVAPELVYKKQTGASLSFKRGSFVDLNGDGLRDWVMSYSENSQHNDSKTLLNTGQGWTPSASYKTEFFHIDYTYSNPGRGWPTNTKGMYVDVNRDGLVDYIEAYADIHGVEHKNAWLNTGNGWRQQNDIATDWLLYDYSGRDRDAHKITISSIFDVNSDGSPDWVKVRKDELATRVNMQSRPNQIESITTNMGVKATPHFASLSAMPGLYTRVPTSSVTNDQITAEEDSFFFGTTMYVTSKLEVTRPDDITKVNESTYHYGGAQVNRMGRGFQGFYAFTVTNERGITSRAEFHQKWPLTGMTFNTTTSNAGGVLSQVENDYGVAEYDASNAQKKRVYPQLASGESKTYEPNDNELLSQKIRTLEYDIYGNVTLETSETKSPSGTSLGIASVNKTYHGYGSAKLDWPISLTGNTTTILSKIGEISATNVTNFEYYPNGQVHRALREPDSLDASVRLITEYTYDSYGNVDTEIVKGFNGDTNARSTRYEYDGNYRLHTYLTNAKGHRSQVKFHSVCDAPETATDPNQLQTSFTYTDFCLEKAVTAPNGVVKTSTYKWGDEIQACSATRGCQSTPKVEVQVDITAQASVTTLFNHFTQPLLVSTQGMDLSEILQTTEYDEYGRAVKQSQPFFINQTPVYQTMVLDDFDRVIRVDLPFETYPGTSGFSQNAYTSNTYGVSGEGDLVVTSRDAEGKFKYTHTNALSQLVKIVDAKSQTMQYRYNAQGNLKETQDHLNNVIEVKYDTIGRRAELNDPDLGVTKYRHSPFGEIIEQEDAEGFIIFSEYDTLGRMIKRRVPINNTDTTTAASQWVFDVSNWEYDQGSNNKGLMTSVTTRTKAATTNEAISYQKTYNYDALNRLDSETTIIKGRSFIQRYGYNSNGQLSHREYPSSGGSEAMSINLNYENGYLSSITDKPLTDAACFEHWRANEHDASGRLKKERLGRFIDTTRLIDNGQGVVRGIQASMTIGLNQQVQNLVYDYDATNNIKLRHDALTGVTEEFDYDDLHRLLEHKRDGNVETTVQYNAIGNIMYKSDVGTYHYNSSKPHALTSVSLSLPLDQGTNLNQFNVNWDWDGESLTKSLPSIHGQAFTYDKKGSIKQSGSRRVYWTPFSKPSLMIAEQANGEQHGSAIEYDAGFERMFKQKATYSGFAGLTEVKESTYYVGKDYERIENKEGIVHRYHIKTGSHAIQIERKDGSSQDDPKYMLTDNLGSTNVIINKHGNVEQRLEFDPWGMRTTATPLLSGETVETDSVNAVTTRGYTGHEMDDEVGLINMNARIYDPYLGLFLSADPVLADTGNMQTFNRYSYVLGNPLKYIDPTGNTHEDVASGSCSSDGFDTGCAPNFEYDQAFDDGYNAGYNDAISGNYYRGDPFLGLDRPLSEGQQGFYDGYDHGYEDGLTLGPISQDPDPENIVSNPGGGFGNLLGSLLNSIFGAFGEAGEGLTNGIEEIITRGGANPQGECTGQCRINRLNALVSADYPDLASPSVVGVPGILARYGAFGITISTDLVWIDSSIDDDRILRATILHERLHVEISIIEGDYFGYDSSDAPFDDHTYIDPFVLRYDLYLLNEDLDNTRSMSPLPDLDEFRASIPRGR